MRRVLTLLTLMCLALVPAVGQRSGQAVAPPQQVQPPSDAQPVQANLDLIIAQIQKAALATNGNLGKLRIDKWKTDAAQKEQLQKMADSIQRNVTYAIPGLISDVENSQGSMSAAFKLYHNITIVFEYLSSLTDAAGALGKKDEYEPLANDAAALDAARQNLSTYIEQTASQIESRKQAPVEPPAPEASDKPLPKGVHIVTDKNGVKRIGTDEDSDKPKKPVKKKTSKAKATPTPTPTPTPSPR